MSRIMGIDPGFDRVGFGIVDVVGSTPSWVYHGCLQTKKTDDFVKRLQQVRDAVQKAITHFQPNAVAIEHLFFQTNVSSAIRVSMARGVILLAIADAGIPVVELTPNQIKQGIAGWGGAEKKQIQQTVQKLLHLDEIPKPDDAADALAIGIVGAYAIKHPSMRG